MRKPGIENDTSVLISANFLIYYSIASHWNDVIVVLKPLSFDELPQVILFQTIVTQIKP